jgi:hypothetical protein
MKNYTDEILAALNNKPLFEIGNGVINYEQATKDVETIRMLQVRKQNGIYTDDVFEFLDDHKEAEKQFFKEVKDAVWGHTYLNPREENKYKRYFVENTRHMQQLDELLKSSNEITKKPKLFDNKLTFLLGKKGVGKTITQNVWLYNKNSILEDKKIFWVRLDVEKLYKLHKKGKNISTEEYFLGQLLYVFCKRFKRFSYIDDITKNVKYTNSTLITEIYNCLYKSPLNDISNNSTLTQAQIKYFGDAQLLFQNKLKKKNYLKITDYLISLEEIIAKDEGTYKDGGKTRLGFAPDRKRSYLIDDVFKDKQSILFKTWIYLGETLKKFILEKEYNVLYIVDGIDNINFDDPEDKERYEKILKQLSDFPLSQDKTGNNHEWIFMAMRHNTYGDLKKFYRGYAPSRNLHDLQIRKIIDIISRNNDMAERILKKRVDYVINKSELGNTCMARVLGIIKETASLTDEERWWNANYRRFLHNYMNLAKYLTFRYYWRSSENSFYNEENIKTDIKKFEDINFYLDGEMYACDEKRIGDDGTSCFNLFGLVSKTELSYFIYTYILLIIKELGREWHTNVKIIDIINCIGFFSIDDSRICISKLVRYGMLEKRYEDDDFVYDITEKGKFILEKFYNSIQYLYYSCLDTKLPDIVFKSIKKSISPNNFPVGVDRCFPSNCIITGISFLNYLKFKNQQILNNRNVERSLSEKGIDKNIFQLPIKDTGDESLKHSLNQMIEIVVKNENHIRKLEEWLQTTK